MVAYLGIDIAVEIPDGFWEQLYYKQCFVIVTAFFYGMTAWDCIICLPDEIRYIFLPEIKALFAKGKRPSIPTLLLFSARLYAPLILILSVNAFFGQPSNCRASWIPLLIFYTLATSNAIAIFIVRCVAIRGSGRILTVILVVLLFAQTALWFTWIFNIVINETLIISKYVGKCQGVVVPRWTWLVFLALGCFDLLIVGLTFQSQVFTSNWGQMKMNMRIWRSGQSLTQRFLIDTCLYYVLSLAVTFVEVAWVYHHPSHDLLTAIVSPVHVWIICSIAPRVVRNLKLYSSRFGTPHTTMVGSRAQQQVNYDLVFGKVVVPDTEKGLAPRQPFTTTSNLVYEVKVLETQSAPDKYSPLSVMRDIEGEGIAPRIGNDFTRKESAESSSGGESSSAPEQSPSALGLQPSISKDET